MSEIEPAESDISIASFSQALSGLAGDRGYMTQIALAEALGKKSSGTVNSWYRGAKLPRSGELYRLVILLEPNDEELDTIEKLYGQSLSEKEGRRILRKKELTPFDAWMEEYCASRSTSLSRLANRLGFDYPSGVSYNHARYLSLRKYSHFLQTAPPALNLSDEETAVFAESIAQTIEQAIANGHQFQEGISGTEIKKYQAQIPCRTYNGAQAAKELGRSRERVRQLKKELDLPDVFTKEDLEKLRDRIAMANRSRRRKITTLNYPKGD